MNTVLVLCCVEEQTIISVNYICPCFESGKEKKDLTKTPLLSRGFLFVLTSEKMPVINDLGPQYQDLHHTEAGRRAARALQLLINISDAACTGC